MVHRSNVLQTRRVMTLMECAVDDFGLNLSGLRVLTEAATGYYALTPLLAAMAGARVSVFARDTRYGSAADAVDGVIKLASVYGVSDRISIVTTRDDAAVGLADIVTNTGMIRPIDAEFIMRLKPTAVIPLMFETWEYRPEDIDLDAARSHGIAVLGTNEHHDLLDTFGYIGLVAIKLLLEANIEVFRSRVIVVGNGEFGIRTNQALIASGADSTLVVLNDGGDILEALESAGAAHADAIVFVEHHLRDTLVGDGGGISASALAQMNNSLVVVHICGGVSRDDLASHGIACHPDAFAPAGHMSVATDYVGAQPLIQLHAAGIRVGQDLSRARLAGLTSRDAEASVLASQPLAQGFQCTDIGATR